MHNIYNYILDIVLVLFYQYLTKPISSYILILLEDVVNSAPDGFRTDSSWYGRLGGFVFSWGTV